MIREFKPDAVTRADTRRRKKQQQRLKGNRERAEMQKRAEAHISFGTWTIFAPKLTSHIGEFTMAFSKPLKRSELYVALAEALGDSWGTTRSIRVSIETPLEWQATRKRIRSAFEHLFTDIEKES